MLINVGLFLTRPSEKYGADKIKTSGRICIRILVKMSNFTYFNKDQLVVAQ